jgi:hypothetical protein
MQRSLPSLVDQTVPKFKELAVTMRAAGIDSRLSEVASKRHCGAEGGDRLVVLYRQYWDHRHAADTTMFFGGSVTGTADLTKALDVCCNGSWG